ncbi:MAG: FAD-binding oxidoreductase, partial [Chloroflexi bacterium]
EIRTLMEFAIRRKVALIPFGGGTTVVGGVEAVTPEGFAGSVCVDMRRLNRLLALDKHSGTATFEAGIRGPELEAILNKEGFTLGHFPQSFEFSSLGGWIATRSAGQKSTGYGKIEDMVLSLRVCTPQGLIETRTVPASASGPSLKEILIGSEGVYGIITQATMRVHPLPEAMEHWGVLFPGFEEGIKALREMLQEGFSPATLRLSDEGETGAYWAMRRVHRGWKGKRDRIVSWYLEKKGYFPGGSLLILGVEGSREEVERMRRGCLDICRRHRGLVIGRGVGEAWYRERFLLPYLRDDMITWGVMVDTLETATVWSNLSPLYQGVKEALIKAIEETGSPAYVMCHISHCYYEGASLYYTFLGRQARGRELEQWQSVKQAATEAILAYGGTLSHHHSVGIDHRPWIREEVGPTGLKILRAVKALLDPQGIMNPGKLL